MLDKSYVEYDVVQYMLNMQVPLFVSTKMTRMRASIFVPTPEIYSKACTKWIGYEKLVVPYFFHDLQSFLIRAIPDVFLDSYMLRYFVNMRKRGLIKDSKK
jgi:17beta-estradiol 17-dehydrogenase / very-long-chain 3-oxoacyl-CoA reductase